jgi:hypothetical protein
MEEIMHKTLLNWPDSDLQLLRVDRTEPDKIKLTAQNLSPCRSSSLAQIKPWAIGSWEVGAPEADQSS